MRSSIRPATASADSSPSWPPAWCSATRASVGPGDRNSEVNQFFSAHSGQGVNFLFGDAHVGYLKTSMTYKVYLGLATRDGEEVIPGDAY